MAKGPSTYNTLLYPGVILRGGSIIMTSDPNAVPKKISKKPLVATKAGSSRSGKGKRNVQAGSS